jgi:hypothetical protein
MLRNNSIQEKTNAFEKNGLIKREVDTALGLLKEFRKKFPFVENLRSKLRRSVQTARSRL